MLLVEDDLVSVSALAGILKRKGFIVLTAHTVAEGLRQLANHPDWVLLDLMLPDGDGARLLEYVRTHQLPMKVIVVTAVNDAARLGRVQELNPYQMMKKPLDLPGLLRTFELKN